VRRSLQGGTDDEHPGFKLGVRHGPSPTGSGLPHPPVFSSVDAERKYRKEQLAAGFRLFGRFGFSEGVVGHITVRDPEHPECFWVNPFGMAFTKIKASDLILVDHKGDVIEGLAPSTVQRS
jgi:Class II Aldolase and Adducin N-terminal domain